jgi:hypothetical protein
LDLIHTRELKKLSALSGFYAFLFAVEGTGLLFALGGMAYRNRDRTVYPDRGLRNFPRTEFGEVRSLFRKRLGRNLFNLRYCSPPANSALNLCRHVHLLRLIRLRDRRAIYENRREQGDRRDRLHFALVARDSDPDSSANFSAARLHIVLRSK